MKRDMELIRRMVLEIEDAPTGYAPGRFEIKGYTPEQIGYHAYLIMHAGLAEGSETSGMGDSGPSAILLNLTWEGHEFADAARDQTRWKKAMGIVQEQGGTVTLAVLTQLLTTLMKGALGLP